MNKVLIALCCSALLVAGCSSDDGDEGDPTPTPTSASPTAGTSVSATPTTSASPTGVALPGVEAQRDLDALADEVNLKADDLMAFTRNPAKSEAQNVTELTAFTRLVDCMGGGRASTDERPVSSDTFVSDSGDEAVQLSSSVGRLPSARAAEFAKGLVSPSTARCYQAYVGAIITAAAAQIPNAKAQVPATARARALDVDLPGLQVGTATASGRIITPKDTFEVTLETTIAFRGGVFVTVTGLGFNTAVSQEMREKALAAVSVRLKLSEEAAATAPATSAPR